MFKRCLLIGAMIISLGLSNSPGQSVQSLMAQKLHPSFRALLADGTSGEAAKGSGPAGLAKNAEAMYDAIITTSDPDAIRANGIQINSTIGRYATAVVTRQELLKLVQLNEVEYVDPGSTNYPMLDLSVPETGANLLQAGFLKNTRYTGKGVLVVIYDTGIDWKHLDFRDLVDTT
jgi:hypothetical protein